MSARKLECAYCLLLSRDAGDRGRSRAPRKLYRSSAAHISLPQAACAVPGPCPGGPSAGLVVTQRQKKTKERTSSTAVRPLPVGSGRLRAAAQMASRATALTASFWMRSILDECGAARREGETRSEVCLHSPHLLFSSTAVCVLSTSPPPSRPHFSAKPPADRERERERDSSQPWRTRLKPRRCPKVRRA